MSVLASGSLLQYGIGNQCLNVNCETQIVLKYATFHCMEFRHACFSFQIDNTHLSSESKWQFALFEYSERIKISTGMSWFKPRW